MSELNSELAKADIAVVSIVLTNDTFYLLNKTNLSLMKDGSIIVNVSRGSIINTCDLIEIIKAIKAILDVLENEPLETNSELWEMGDVYLTPHNSFISNYMDIRLMKIIMRNILNR